MVTTRSWHRRPRAGEDRGRGGGGDGGQEDGGRAGGRVWMEDDAEEGEVVAIEDLLLDSVRASARAGRRRVGGEGGLLGLVEVFLPPSHD